MSVTKKAIASILCIFLLIVIIIPFIKVEAYPGSDPEKPVYHDGIWAYQIEDGDAVLVGVSEIQYGESCGPPSFLGGYPLKKINGITNGAWTGIKTTKFIIPPGVEEINNCNGGGFTSIVIPKSLKSIGFSAFPNCYGFTTIYYEGTAEDWNNVYIDYPGLSNKPVLNATKHFEYVYDESYYEPFKNLYELYGRLFEYNLDFYTSNLSSSRYDPQLANILAALSAAAYDENQIKEAYHALGFADVETKGYSFFDEDRCSYSIAIKNSEYNDEKICLITLRGSDKFSASDWLCNIDIATYDEKHQGFLVSAVLIRDQIFSKLDTLSNVKFVITGHSRGAAVGNLLAVELMGQGVNAGNVYNYNYACPDVVCAEDTPNYNNIFNLCNTADAVPYVPGAIGKSWGKYGRTLWFTKDADGFFASHSIDLYLKFFNNRFDTDDWPFDIDSMCSGVLTKVFCPVDVILTDEQGKAIASVINGEINYYDNNETEVLVFIDGDKKIIYCDDDIDFNVSLIGTDNGTMTLTYERCNLFTGEIYGHKTFSNVELEKGKTMYSPVSEVNDLDDIELFVVEEKDGEVVYTHTINIDGTEDEIPCKHAWNNGEITKNPTHIECGEKTYTCIVCNEIKTEEIEKTSEHIFGDWIVIREATAFESGIKEKTCVCGYSVTEDITQITVEERPIGISIIIVLAIIVAIILSVTVVSILLCSVGVAIFLVIKKRRSR